MRIIFALAIIATIISVIGCNTHDSETYGCSVVRQAVAEDWDSVSYDGEANLWHVGTFTAHSGSEDGCWVD